MTKPKLKQIKTFSELQEKLYQGFLLTDAKGNSLMMPDVHLDFGAKIRDFYYNPTQQLTLF